MMDEEMKTPAKPRSWFLTCTLALGGMVLGALVGIGVQEAIASTGALGPGLDVLIDEQDANFERVHAKLAALAGAGDVTTARSITTELQGLITEQEGFARRAKDELLGARAEIARLKEEALDARGTVGGANLWLGVGESVTVGEASSVLSLLAVYPNNSIRVNAAGENKQIALGDSIEFGAQASRVRVFYKQAEARADGRVGFDVVANL